MNYTNTRQQHFDTFLKIAKDLQETVDRSKRKAAMDKFGLENHSLLKGTKTLINRIIRLKGKTNQKKNILRIKSAIKKLNLILNSSYFYIHPADRTKKVVKNFKNKINEICDRLFSTLPAGESIQLELFDEKSHEMTQYIPVPRFYGWVNFLEGSNILDDLYRRIFEVSSPKFTQLAIQGLYRRC